MMTDSATNEPARAAKRRGWAGLALIVVALLAIGNLSNLGGDSDADSDNGGRTTPTADTARTACQDFVIDRLDVPESAEFGLPSVTSAGRSTWTVTGSAAVTNDAGARVHVDYECTVHGDDSGRWSLVELTHARR